MTKTRRRLLIVLPILCLLLLLGGFFWFFSGDDLKVRSAKVSVGMTQAQAEQILGKAYLSLNRVDNRGRVLCWVDQVWQLDICIDRDGFVEWVATKPSDSEYNRLKGRLNAWFK